MMAHGTLLVVALGLVGCDTSPELPSALPDTMATVVHLERGGYASIVVELHRPGKAPTVRMTPGVVAVGPGWAHAVEWTANRTSSGEPDHVVEVEHLGAPASFAVARYRGSATPSFQAIDADGLWMEADGNWQLAPGTASPVSVEDAAPVSGGQHRWAGPGHGFEVRLLGDELELLLPKMDPNAWASLVRGVDEVLGTWWFASEELPVWETILIDKRFKQVAAVAVSPGDAKVDGNLAEWADASAHPVDRNSQVFDGTEGWDGPRDGSFGVAVRRTEEGLVLAVRVRDDRLIPGRDHLLVLAGDQTHRVPLVNTAGPQSGRNWEAVFAEATDYGTAFELAIDGPEMVDAEVLPLVVHLVDVDPNDVTTRIGTAGWPGLVRLAAL